MNQRIELTEVWRDGPLLEEIRAEVRKQAQKAWRPWELLLPPDLLWPMVSEVSEGMSEPWSPVVDNVAVQVGQQGEVAIRFVLEDMRTSPVMVRSLPFRPRKSDDIVSVEVHHGNAV